MEILGVNISELQKNDILEKFFRQDNGYICVTSVHGLIEANENSLIMDAFQSSFANIPDGMPIIYYSKLFRKVKLNRIPGYDLLDLFLDFANNNNLKIATVGSTPKTLNNFKIKLNYSFPNIIFEDFNTDDIEIFSKESVNNISNFINQAKPDCVLIFLSTPKQDWLMYELNKAGLREKFIGFGAAVDYYVGNIEKAPNLLSKLSLEWFFRLVQDPKRLYKRYFKIVPKFFYLLIFRNTH
tara:strand:- start:3438 stop:4157 length:720 start_codon:yes stop_codon:yes gene_type:complete